MELTEGILGSSFRQGFSMHLFRSIGTRVIRLRGSAVRFVVLFRLLPLDPRMIVELLPKLDQLRRRLQPQPSIQHA